MCCLNKILLIVASSGRMLAHSARRAGYIPLVVDLFADQDTRDVAEAFHKVTSLAVNEISPIISRYTDQYNVRDVIYGSGLEAVPESLLWLSQQFNVLGNSYPSLQRIIDKKEFFRCLSKLKIPFPQVQFYKPKNAGSWLIKPGAGEGGAGIRKWQVDDRDESQQVSVYWQRQADGVSMSVLFLADGQNVHIIGFNQQWTEAGSFVFSGIIKTPDLSEKIQGQVAHWLNKLVPEFNLLGLNSMDFIVEGKQRLVLEINSRPSASMMLYDAEFQSGLLQAHINACRGRFTFNKQTSPEIIALQILYASKDQYISAGFDWPDWSMDWPVGPCKIYSSQPICSIIATHSNSQLVYQQLRNKQQIIIDSIEGK